MGTSTVISVITPSVRPEGLKLVEKALKRQTYQGYEWLIDDSKEKNEGDYWGVYKAYNRLVKRSRGDLIISWQDYTFAKPDALEKFLYHFETEPKTIVSGVGGKYSDDTWVEQTWKDPRERSDLGSFYPCYFNDIELNFASFPKEAFYAVGGFDEELDKYSSLCGLDVLARLNILGGWDFKLDQTNKSYSLEHGRLTDWDKYLPFNGPWQAKLKEYEQNPVLSYLS